MLLDFFKKNKILYEKTFQDIITLDYNFLFRYTNIFIGLRVNKNIILNNQKNFLNLLYDIATKNINITIYNSDYNLPQLFSLNFLINYASSKESEITYKNSVVLLLENRIKKQNLKNFEKYFYNYIFIAPYFNKFLMKNFNFFYIFINLDTYLNRYIYINFIKYFIISSKVKYNNKNIYNYFYNFKKLYLYIN